MDPILTKILEGVPYSGTGTTLERNALIGVIRNLIQQDKYTVDYILNYCESVGYQRQMAEEVFKELTGLSPKLIVNNNEYYKMPAYVPNMCIAWGISKSHKEKAFYIVPFEYGFAVMEKDEVNAPVPTVISATIPEAIGELKKVAKGIQTLDKIITKKLLETENVQSNATDVHQVNLPYSVSPLQVLKKNFKDKVLNVTEFERQASKLLQAEEITVDEAEDLMKWKQELIDEDESYADETLQIDENWKPLDAEDIDENEPDYENRVKEAFTQLSGMIEELDIFKDYAKRSGNDKLFDTYLQLGREIADEWDIKPESLFGEMAIENAELVKRLEDIDKENFNKEVETWKKSQEKFPWKGGSKKEAFQVHNEKGIRDFKAWSGAVDTQREIIDQGKADAFDAMIEELYPQGIDNTHLNDLLWFEADWIYKTLGMQNPYEDEEDEEIDASLKRASELDKPVRPWYLEKYKTDELGQEINPNVTFAEIDANPQKVYDLLGVGDSIVRERVFNEISHLKQESGHVIFDKWLGRKDSKKIATKDSYDDAENIIKELENRGKTSKETIDKLKHNLEVSKVLDKKQKTYQDNVKNQQEKDMKDFLNALKNRKSASKKIKSKQIVVNVYDIDWDEQEFDDDMYTYNYDELPDFWDSVKIDVQDPNDDTEIEDAIKTFLENEYDGYTVVNFNFNVKDKKQASKKVTAENMDLDDIEEENNKDTIQEELDKIEEKPIDEILSETTPEQYFDEALKEDKVDTINDVVSKCIDKFVEKFKDFEKYTIQILSYNTKVLGDYEPVKEEMVEDKEINANAILEVILSITNNADEATIKKALAVFSITNGELHWRGTIRGENDQVVAFTEEGLDALFEVNEPSEEELEDII